MARAVLARRFELANACAADSVDSFLPAVLDKLRRLAPTRIKRVGANLRVTIRAKSVARFERAPCDGHIIMIATARRQNYAAVAHIPGLRRPLCMVDYCVYFCYRAALALITTLPLRFVFSLGNGLGFIAWVLLPTYRQLARRNVEIAFGPEKSAAEKSRIVRRHFQRLGANLLSGMKLNAMPLEKVVALVAIEGADEAHRELRAGRPVVVVLSHLGNWEFFAQIVPQYFAYTRLSTVYQKLGNRHLDQFVRQQRARFGVELFDRSEGFQEAVRLLRGGGVIGI
jgi:lauroyl/myristoyl acyltransferase